MIDLIPTPKHKDLIYDVGMHHGEDTEFYLRKGFRVVAFEADPENVRFSRERLAEFIRQGQLAIVEGAIVDSEAGCNKVPFYKNDERSVLGTIRREWAERNVGLGKSSSVIEVDSVDFGDAIRENGIPYYMKIDIEGCDVVCLRALSRFRERPDYISIESDKTSFSNIRREIDLLIELGYDRFQAVEQSDLPACQTPPFPPREGKHVAQSFEPGSSGLFGAELDDNWKSRAQVLRQYRAIRLGYFLVGDNGIMNTWKFRGAWRLQSWARRLVRRLTDAPVPGWYDTHARYSGRSNANGSGR